MDPGISSEESEPTNETENIRQPDLQSPSPDLESRVDALDNVLLSREQAHAIEAQTDRDDIERQQKTAVRKGLERINGTAPDILRQDPETRQTVERNMETVTRNGKEYTVHYVPQESLYPTFGDALGTQARVRQDLTPRVKQFVREHELYHCQDQQTWGGWIGSELRANLIPGLKDPLGLIATIWATLSDRDRIQLYLQRLRMGR